MKNKSYITKDEYESIKNTSLNFKKIAEKYLKEDGSETFDHFEMFQLRTIPDIEGNREGTPCAFQYQRAFVNHDQEHKDFYNENIRGAYITDFVKGMPQIMVEVWKNI